MSNDFYFIANMLLVSEGVMQLHVLKMHEKEIEEILASLQRQEKVLQELVRKIN